MMRTSIIKLLSLGVFGAALLSGCSSDGSTDDNKTVPIELMAGIDNVSVSEGGTRAPMNGFRNTPVVFANGLNGALYSEYWNARISVQGFVVFIPQRIYNMNDDVHRLRGFYPAPATTPVGGVVDYDIDGDNDIMVSTEADMGSLTSKKPLPFVTFKHLLTQFRFYITNDGTVPYEQGKLIKKITISTTNPQGLAQKCHLDLPTATLSYSNYAQEIVIYEWTGSNDLEIPSKGGQRENAFIEMFEPGKEMKVSVVYQDEDASKPDKVKEFTLNLSTANGTSAVEALASVSYKITLAFKGSAIHVIPGLATWASGKINNNTEDPVTIW